MSDAAPKRARTDLDSRPAYPRKRAAQACLTCRRRRTKCDNERPSCTSCRGLGIACVYQDGDKSSFDSASLAILQRLDHLEKLFKEAHPHPELSFRLRPGSSRVVSPETIAPEIFTSPVQETSNPPGSCSINIEAIMEWPVLQVPGSNHQTPHLKSLLRTHTLNAETRPLVSSDIDTSGALVLLQLFLDNFHIYNPVLKVLEIEEYVRYTVFNGLGWDSKSCLLLLVYALGTLVTQDDQPNEPDTSSEFRQTAQFRRADAFFFAAQRRMGLLLCSSGIIEAQVFFLAGVYLMTTMRPVEAWKMFVQALACCQAFSPARGDTDEEGEEEYRLHKSIFWTCFKSELELRLELNIIETSAWNLRYPAFFPEPPKSLQSRGEPAWYFYLAEVALRRLGNRVLMHIYRANPPEAPLADQISAVLDFELQADSWSSSLPESLSLDSPPPEHGPEGDAIHVALRFILEGHLLDCYEMMYWPFVTMAIHGQLPEEASSRAHLFALRGFEVCTRRIRKNETGFHHRHHGTWLMLRSCTRSALVLVAAARSGLDTMLPPGWEASVAKVIELLKYWRGETADARDKLEILEALMR